MSTDLFISELLFSIIILIGVCILWEFIISKNGILRKLMIWYFAVEIYVYLFAAIFFYCEEINHPLMSTGLFRIVVLIPKALIKLRLLYYLKTKK